MGKRASPGSRCRSLPRASAWPGPGRHSWVGGCGRHWLPAPKPPTRTPGAHHHIPHHLHPPQAPPATPPQAPICTSATPQAPTATRSAPTATPPGTHLHLRHPRRQRVAPTSHEGQVGLRPALCMGVQPPHPHGVLAGEPTPVVVRHLVRQLAQRHRPQQPHPRQRQPAGERAEGADAVDEGLGGRGWGGGGGQGVVGKAALMGAT